MLKQRNALIGSCASTASGSILLAYFSILSEQCEFLQISTWFEDVIFDCNAMNIANVFQESSTTFVNFDKNYVTFRCTAIILINPSYVKCPPGLFFEVQCIYKSELLIESTFSSRFVWLCTRVTYAALKWMLFVFYRSKNNCPEYQTINHQQQKWQIAQNFAQNQSNSLWRSRFHFESLIWILLLSKILGNETEIPLSIST